MVESKDRLNKIINIFLKEIQKKYRIDNAYLYGSFAKGTFNIWSDIDIAIVSSDFSGDLFEDRLALMRLASTIDDRIEPRPFKTEFFNRNDPLADEVQKNGIRLI
ncbi:MAG: nucleotidyltransferase domain-containing protein [Deltaproteobacteria bacterium]|jgi:predicted nucleotidyltransferase|nr:nucleotidyltransferase domain-containing protein [Deltaproteobacteria bacterium]